MAKVRLTGDQQLTRVDTIGQTVSTECPGKVVHVRQDSISTPGILEIFQKLGNDLRKSLTSISQNNDQILRQHRYWSFPYLGLPSAAGTAMRREITKAQDIGNQMTKEANSLKLQIEKIQARNLQLNQDMKQFERLRAETQQLNQEIISLKKSQQQLMEKNGIYENEIVKLKRMMTAPATEKEDPLDQEVQQRLQHVKNVVQSIVHKHLQTSGEYSAARTPLQRDFYESGFWSECKDEGSRQRRLRHAIWLILYEHIFSKPLFGVGNPFHDVLGELEDSLKLAHVDMLKVAEWRRRTVNCIDLLKNRSEHLDPLDVPNGVSQMLLELVEPVKLVTHDGAAHQRLESEIGKLCHEAYKYALELRQSKSTFVWRNPHPGETVPSAVEHECGIEVMHFEGGGTDEDIVGSQISYTIFGSLTKTHWKYENETVMVPAEVVCIKARKEA